MVSVCKLQVQTLVDHPKDSPTADLGSTSAVLYNEIRRDGRIQQTDLEIAIPLSKPILEMCKQTNLQVDVAMYKAGAKYPVIEYKDPDGQRREFAPKVTKRLLDENTKTLRVYIKRRGCGGIGAHGRYNADRDPCTLPLTGNSLGWPFQFVCRITNLPMKLWFITKNVIIKGKQTR